MASIHQAGSKRYRVCYTLRLPGGRRRRKRDVETRTLAQHLKVHLEQLEQAVRVGMATAAQISDWVGRRYLTADEVSVAFPLATGWQPALEAVDLEVLRVAYEDYAVRHSKAHDASRRTHLDRMSVLRYVLRWLASDHPDLQLDRDIVSRWVSQQLADGYAHQTVRHRRQCLCVLLDLAQARGMVRDNPARKVRMVEQKPQVPRRILADAEIRQVLEASVGHVQVLQGCLATVVRLGLYAGLRPEEMCWLAWTAIDFKHGLLHVQAAQDAAGARWQPKDAELRTVDLKASFVAFLQQERRRQQQEGLLGPWVVAVRIGGGGAPTGRPAHPTTLRYAFYHFSQALGLDPAITLYCLRHTYCTALLRAGVDLETVRARMGHARLVTTQRYLHAIRPEAHPSDVLPY